MDTGERLRDMRPTESPPTVEELGGFDAVLRAVPDLSPDLVPRFVEAMATWSGTPAHPTLIVAAVERLPEVEGPLDSASCVDVLLALAVASQNGCVARAFMTQLLLMVDEGDESATRALRASYAVRAAVDLALLDAGVSVHGVLATLENLPEIRAEMAPGVARAAGRLWEHHKEPFLRRVLEERVLPHEDAAGDGLLELGLDSLRVAFDAADGNATLEALDRAEELFDRARTQDEDRPDARVFAAACRAVAAFSTDGGALSEALDELTEARAELERYTAEDVGGFRGATPLRSVADWHVLAATLRGLQSHLERPDMLNLRPAIEALSDAYTGMRLGVLEDEVHGFIGFIRPLLRDRVEASASLRDAMAQYAEEEGSPVSAGELTAEVVRPKAKRCVEVRPSRRVRRNQ
jgi:hypothetical protein